MKKIINVIGFYIVWWGCIFGVLNDYTYSGPILALLFIIIHMKFVAIESMELRLICYISILGTIVDTSFILLGLLGYEGGYGKNIPIAPLWVTSMWACFAMGINHSMVWLKNKYFLSTLLGIIFGPLVYLSGEKVGVIQFISSFNLSVIVIAILWGLAIPIMYLINEKLEL